MGRCDFLNSCIKVARYAAASEFSTPYLGKSWAAVEIAWNLPSLPMLKLVRPEVPTPFSVLTFHFASMCSEGSLYYMLVKPGCS